MNLEENKKLNKEKLNQEEFNKQSNQEELEQKELKQRELNQKELKEKKLKQKKQKELLLQKVDYFKNYLEENNNIKDMIKNYREEFLKENKNNDQVFNNLYVLNKVEEIKIKLNYIESEENKFIENQNNKKDLSNNDKIIILIYLNHYSFCYNYYENILNDLIKNINLEEEIEKIDINSSNDIFIQFNYFINSLNIDIKEKERYLQLLFKKKIIIDINKSDFNKELNKNELKNEESNEQKLNEESNQQKLN